MGLVRIVSRLSKPHRNYNARVSSRGLVVDFGNGLEIASSIIDKSYFVPEWFTERELEILARFEGLTQRVAKESGPRRHSGLYAYSHIDRDAETAFNTAKQAGVSLDVVTTLALLGHDSIEDAVEVRRLLDEWERALITGTGYDNLKSKAQELSKKREEIRDRYTWELYRYLDQTGARGTERNVLRKAIDAAVRLMYHLTRFQDELPYALSMEFQFARQGNESLENMIRRANVKLWDITSNHREVRPLLPDVMGQIKLAFNDRSTVTGNYQDGRQVGYVIGQELADRFGGVGDGAEMPPAVRVVNAFNSMFALQYLHETLNRYGTDIEAGKYGNRARELLELTKVSKKSMIEATLALLNSTIEIYESKREISEIKDRVDGIIKRAKMGRFYYQVTLDGIINDWLVYEAGGRRRTESLDRSTEGRREAYTTARHLHESVQMFGMFYEKGNLDALGRQVLITSPDAPYDPAKHNYFTLGCVDMILSLMRGPNFWDLVRGSRQPPANRSAYSMFF